MVWKIGKKKELVSLYVARPELTDKIHKHYKGDLKPYWFLIGVVSHITSTEVQREIHNLRNQCYNVGYSKYRINKLQVDFFM
jgi:predicted CoA-binding protein